MLDIQIWILEYFSTQLITGIQTYLYTYDQCVLDIPWWVDRLLIGPRVYSYTITQQPLEHSIC